MVSTKRCTKCNKTRPVTDFRVDNSRKDGRQSVCIECKVPEHYAKIKEQQSLDLVNKKRCAKCLKIYDKSNFSSSADGRGNLRSYCKNCEIDYRKSVARSESSQKYVRSEKGKENARRYYKRAAQDGRIKHILDRRYASAPEAIRAHRKISYAVRAKHIPPAKELRCKHCGQQAQQYHHPDYSKPLDVIPLCKMCHEAVHHQ